MHSLVASLLGLTGIINSTTTEAEPGQEWWSPNKQDGPFGATTTSLAEYLSKGFKWAHLTSAAYTTEIINTFATNTSEKPRRIVMHTYDHPGVHSAIQKVQKMPHVRGTVLLSIDKDAIEVWPQREPWMYFHPEPMMCGPTMVVLIENKCAPPFQGELIMNQMKWK